MFTRIEEHIVYNMRAENFIPYYVTIVNASFLIKIIDSDCGY